MVHIYTCKFEAEYKAAKADVTYTRIIVVCNECYDNWSNALSIAKTSPVQGLTLIALKQISVE